VFENTEIDILNSS